MALIKCPKCGKEISDKAKKCVGCGREVNLSILNMKADEVVSNETDLKKDTSYECEIMLKEAELEIEKMKENAKQEVKSMNESAKAMAIQKQKELDLEYKKRKKELDENKEFLQKMQGELEQSKKAQQISESQRTEMVKRKAVLPNINILFILIPVAIMLCFMIIVWRRLDSFSAEIEFLVSNNAQAESQIQNDTTENMPDEKVPDIMEDKTQKNYTEVDSAEESFIENDITEPDAVETVNANDDMKVAASIENDSRIQTTFDSRKTGKYTHLLFTMKNISDENIKISINSYQYINDVAVKNSGIIEYNSEIPAGKATIIDFCFERDDISFSEINKIELCCKSSDNTGNEIEHSFIFDGLNISIK